MEHVVPFMGNKQFLNLLKKKSKYFIKYIIKLKTLNDQLLKNLKFLIFHKLIIKPIHIKKK
jgi:hypothetical protein